MPAIDRKIELDIINDAHLRPKITISVCSGVLRSRVSLSFLSQKPAMAPCQHGWKGVTEGNRTSLAFGDAPLPGPHQTATPNSNGQSRVSLQVTGLPLRRQRRSVLKLCVDLLKFIEFSISLHMFLLPGAYFIISLVVLLRHSCMHVAFLPSEKVRSMKRRATVLPHVTMFQ